MKSMPLKQSDEFFDRLLNVFHVVEEFFYAGGRGLSRELMSGMQIYKVR